MPSLQQNIRLADHSTFKIGGPARFFCTIRDTDELQEALDSAIQNSLKVFIIGHGSNLLISDKGFDGLVLKMESQTLSSRETATGVEIHLGAGIPLTRLSLDMQKEGLSGLEWSAGIPATLGGAIANNAGANGKDISSVLNTVDVFELQTDENGVLTGFDLKQLEKAECGFAYRKSIFKDTKRFIIFSATLELERGEATKIKEETLRSIENRRVKQPLEFPNIGSIFKNPILTPKEQEDLSERYPQFQDICKNGTVPAGWLIELCDLKGKKIGGAAVSEKHANFIINTGNATAEDVLALISLIKQKVRDKFGVQLQEEIEYVGFRSASQA